MDPQIIAAVIGGIATVAGVVIGWWLYERKSRGSTVVSSRVADADVRILPQSTDGRGSAEPGATRHHPTSGPVTALSQITVKEIVETINSAPPFQKDQIAKQYNGIKVKWTGYLNEAKEDPRDKESVRVNLHVKRDAIIGPSFWFTEKLARLPEIRTLKRETPICVVGEIVSASGAGLYVDLRPITIEVLENHA